jgi:hypothetical protein
MMMMKKKKIMKMTMMKKMMIDDDDDDDDENDDDELNEYSITYSVCKPQSAAATRKLHHRTLYIHTHIYIHRYYVHQ